MDDWAGFSVNEMRKLQEILIALLGGGFGFLITWLLIDVD